MTPSIPTRFSHCRRARRRATNGVAQAKVNTPFYSGAGGQTQPLVDRFRPPRRSVKRAAVTCRAASNSMAASVAAISYVATSSGGVGNHAGPGYAPANNSLMGTPAPSGRSLAMAPDKVRQRPDPPERDNAAKHVLVAYNFPSMSPCQDQGRTAASATR